MAGAGADLASRAVSPHLWPKRLLGPVQEKEVGWWAEGYESTRVWMNALRHPLYRFQSLRKLQRYCAYTGFTPDELIALRRAQANHESEKMLDAFVGLKPYTHNATALIATAVKSFYKGNYEGLARGCGRISPRKEKPYRCPTPEDLEAMLLGASVRDRALTLFLAKTGMRKGTATLLTWGHVWPDLFDAQGATRWDGGSPVHVGILSKELKGEYAGVEQHTFLDAEAVNALLAYRRWLEEKRLRRAVRRDDPLWVRETGPVKAIIHQNLADRIIKAAERAGLDYSVHDLRRFCQTALEEARVPPNWVKKILGHKVSGEENPYSRPKVEQLREAYRTAYPQLQAARRSRREAEVEASLKATESLVVQVLREAVKENPEIAEKMGRSDELRQAINILYEKYVRKGSPEPRGEAEKPGNPGNPSGHLWQVQTARTEELDRLLEQGYDIVMQLPDGRYKLRKRLVV